MLTLTVPSFVNTIDFCIPAFCQISRKFMYARHKLALYATVWQEWPKQYQFLELFGNDIKI